MKIQSLIIEKKKKKKKQKKQQKKKQTKKPPKQLNRISAEGALSYNVRPLPVPICLIVYIYFYIHHVYLSRRNSDFEPQFFPVFCTQLRSVGRRRRGCCSVVNYSI